MKERRNPLLEVHGAKCLSLGAVVVATAAGVLQMRKTLIAPQREDGEGGRVREEEEETEGKKEGGRNESAMRESLPRSFAVNCIPSLLLWVKQRLRRKKRGPTRTSGAAAVTAASAAGCGDVGGLTALPRAERKGPFELFPPVSARLPSFLFPLRKRREREESRSADLGEGKNFQPTSIAAKTHLKIANLLGSQAEDTGRFARGLAQHGHVRRHPPLLPCLLLLQRRSRRLPRLKVAVFVSCDRRPLLPPLSLRFLLSLALLEKTSFLSGLPPSTAKGRPERPKPSLLLHFLLLCSFSLE
jgi:hypothetical protein